jgi:hypothetical protein
MINEPYAKVHEIRVSARASERLAIRLEEMDEERSPEEFFGVPVRVDEDLEGFRYEISWSETMGA